MNSLLTTPSGPSTTSPMIRRDIRGQMKTATTQISNVFGTVWEREFSIKPGKDSIAPCLPMVRQGRANHTPFLGTGRTKESFRWHPKSFSKELNRVKTREFRSKSRFRWSKYTWTRCRIFLCHPPNEKVHYPSNKP